MTLQFRNCGPYLLIVATVIVGSLWSCSSCREAPSEHPSPLTDTCDRESASDSRGDLRFVFYNVENLFDVYDDSTTEDDEFLPWGIKGWNRERFELKLRRIYKVLVNAGGWELPDLIGLCEIENRFVLNELIFSTPLSKANYRIIHEDSPDARGIDLGFLYRTEKFTPIRHQAIRIDFPFDSVYKTRDILWIQGLTVHADTIHIFLCHFPSRRGGEAVSEPKRLYVAGVLRSRLDSILSMNPDARIIITGDFNDEPVNSSIYDVLQARGHPGELESGQLFNLMYDFQVRKGSGTYKFRGFWNMLDQFIVSQAMLDSGGRVFCGTNSAQIYKEPWLMTEDDDAPGSKPFRTYSGAYYYGGYSDHLPIFLDIYFNRDGP